MRYRSQVLASVLLTAALGSAAGAGTVDLTQISVDRTTDTRGQHRTEVDPSQAASGDTIVTTFQDGELKTNGAVAVGWATSHDGGHTWKHGYIPGTTTDFWVQVVAYDRKHLTWLIIMLPQDKAQNTLGMQVSRSADGINWTEPQFIYGPVDVNSEGLDRPWVNCDNHPASPFYGNCYVAWRDATPTASTNIVQVSRDGGGSWSVPVTSPDQTAGSIGGIAIQPNGRLFLIGAYAGPDLPQLYAIGSTDGGKTLRPSTYIATEYFNFPGQGWMRADPFPSAGVAADGTIYVVSADCRFRPGCAPGGNIGSANDVVYTTSKDGVNWTSLTRIPIDPVTSNIDHFIAGVAVRSSAEEPSEDGDRHVNLAVNYYYLTDATCDPTVASARCRLFAGFVSSADGGHSWSKPIQVAGPMNVLDLTFTEFGYFVANDVTSIYVGNRPQAVYSIARPRDPRSGQLRQAIFSARFARHDE